MIPPIAYIALTALVIGTTSGYKVSENIHLAREASILKAEKARFVEVQKINTGLRKDLEESTGKTIIKYKYVLKQLPKVLTNAQKTDSECNITPDAARLLNKFISSIASPYRGTLQEAKPLKPIKFSETSGVSVGKLVEYLSYSVTEYNLLAKRHNLLVGWHESIEE